MLGTGYFVRNDGRMYKRFWIICLVMGLGLLVLSVLGLSSLGMHEKGLRAERQQEFVAVAEQVRFDIKKKLDAFILTEQGRPYTDYQYYYVPMASNDATALVRSPLAGSISNGLAYGYFQLDSASQFSNPYAANTELAAANVKVYFENLKSNLLPTLGNGESLQVQRIAPPEPKDEYKVADSLGRRDLYYSRTRGGGVSKPASEAEGNVQKTISTEGLSSGKLGKKEALPTSKADLSRRSTYPISLDESQQGTQVTSRSRGNVVMNEYNTAMQQTQMGGARPARQQGPEAPRQRSAQQQDYDVDNGLMADTVDMQQAELPAESQALDDMMGSEKPADDLVQIRVEPFVPITVAGADGDNGIFAGQVFLLRHVQIEDKHWVQGFRLDESALIGQVTDSAQQFLRRGMGFDISKTELAAAAYTAVLDFGFGEVVLNLTEQQPGWINARVAQIRNWFFAILAVVWLAVTVALAAFWRNMYEQVQLSRKKDDFISAVSHELRTPLTSIRMYTEMLEKDWVKTDEKRKEYYTTMRQESERLTRLIENVLDFSRIQRGKKQYDFIIGDVNACVKEVVEMMRPYADRAGFKLLTSFDDLEPFAFDRDAVVQIVINLIDNALKYAKEAEDKHILICTGKQKDYVTIEVEDHGPGVSRNQQKKIFEAFYRCGDESTRQATGTGLGLALVKRFAEAHHGFVEISTSKPHGALFRVGLPCHEA